MGRRSIYSPRGIVVDGGQGLGEDLWQQLAFGALTLPGEVLVAKRDD